MKVKQIVLMAIRGNKELRRRLKIALEISEPTLYRLINPENEEENKDSDLTKAIALRVIREETGLTDVEILEEAATEAAQ